MPSFTLSRFVGAPPAEVFAVFADIENAPLRAKDIVRVEMLTTGPVGLGTRFKETRIVFKREATETFTFTAFEPGSAYELTATSCGAEYRTRFTFTPEGAGTRVELLLRTRAAKWWAKLFTPLAYLMIGTMKKCVARDLDDLQAAAESKKAA